MKHIGFIGTGIMGCGMISNLLAAGFSVTVYNRTKEKAQPVLEKGAVWADSIAQCVRGKDAVITIVGFPADVEEVYFGKEGILASAAPGTYLIDMTTTSPQLSQKIYAAASQKGLHAIDAPVTGGDTGARSGTLSILVGGDEADFQAALPIFQAMGKTIVYEGEAGSGQHTKLVNQIMIAGAVSGVCEALSYAKKTGLDLSKVLEAVQHGAAGSAQLTTLAPRILAGDMAPGFYIKHFIKDMKLAEEESRDRQLSLPVLHQVLVLYEELQKEGKDQLGTQGLIEYYQQ